MTEFVPITRSRVGWRDVIPGIKGAFRGDTGSFVGYAALVVVAIFIPLVWWLVLVDTVSLAWCVGVGIRANRDGRDYNDYLDGLMANMSPAPSHLFEEWDK
jgi:hypothetical protein